MRSNSPTTDATSPHAQVGFVPDLFTQFHVEVRIGMDHEDLDPPNPHTWKLLKQRKVGFGQAIENR